VSASELLFTVNTAIYLALFARVLLQAARRPTRVSVDIALLFSVPAFLAALGSLTRLGLVPQPLLSPGLATGCLLLIALLLFRLVDDFVIVKAWVRRAISAANLALALAVVLTPAPQPAWLFPVVFAVVVVMLLYGGAACLLGARKANGITRRRLQTVAAGSLLFALAFFISLPLLFVPALATVLMIISNTCGVAAGVAYFVGFAPPRLLRRAWQEPELRAFLGRAARLPRLPDTAAIVAELERGAALALGTPAAAIGLFDPDSGGLRFAAPAPLELDPDAPGPVGAAWSAQTARLATGGLDTDPALLALAGRPTPAAALAAPITAGERRLGVLVTWAPRAPLFADDDLALLALLADQAAVILESRALIDDAARVRAREEAARLKDDFLSAAAHDLKTPLTTLIARAQLLERRALRNPQAPADLASIQTLVREGQRLQRLVVELLDAARAERGRLLGPRAPADLAAIAAVVCERHTSAAHPCLLDGPAPLVVEVDAARIEQLLENLVENAVKYSPDGGTVTVTLRHDGDWAGLSVRDEGVGIPEADLPFVFDRFFRGSNSDDRRFPGMGLGLFICRGIAEAHGGMIAVRSRRGAGTTFEVSLPLVAAEATVGRG